MRSWTYGGDCPKIARLKPGVLPGVALQVFPRPNNVSQVISLETGSREQSVLLPLRKASALQRCRFSPATTSLKKRREKRQASFVCDATSSANPHADNSAKLAVFVSGGGSNFKSIHSAILDGRIDGQIVAVVSDKPGCGGCQYAEIQSIPILAYPRSSKHAPEGLSPGDLVTQLQASGVEYVLLAGYLKLLPPELIAAYPRRIMNIHPALLPAFGGRGFYGMRVHEAVIASGARVSGPTIHFVDEKYDHGPILAQQPVPVFHTDTPKDLQQRVLAEEHKLYPEVVAALCSGLIQWRSDGVPYISKQNVEAVAMS